MYETTSEIKAIIVSNHVVKQFSVQIIDSNLIRYHGVESRRGVKVSQSCREIFARATIGQGAKIHPQIPKIVSHRQS